MISFRYHLVSLVAVILALAIGIVVGTTALNGPITSDLRHQVDELDDTSWLISQSRTDLADQVKTLQGQVDTAGQFATTFGNQVVDGTLTDQQVLIFALPGTASGMISGTGLARANTIAWSAMAATHSGRTRPGPLTPTWAAMSWADAPRPPAPSWKIAFR